MTVRQGSESSFDELQSILICYEESARTISVKAAILALLKQYGNGIRQKDGTFFSVQGSFATSQPDTYVVGLRYRKADGSFTEDHFLFERHKNMRAMKGKELERYLPEYKGTHKWQPLDVQAL